MKRLTIATATLALAGCAFADPAGNPWTVEDDPVEPPAAERPTATDEPVELENPTPTPTTIEPLSCALQHSEFEETWWVEPRFTGFSPNEALFVSAAGFDDQAITIAVADGETYRSNDLNGLGDVNSDWTSGVFSSTSHVGGEWRDLTSGQVHYATEDLVAAGVVAEQGDQAAFVVCEDQATIVRLVDLDGSFREVALSNDGHCYRWGVNRNQVGFTTDGRYLAVGAMNGKLWSVDTETLATNSIEPHAMLEEPDVYYSTIVSAISVRPGAAEVVTTGSDGALRRWSLPALEQIGDDIEVGVFVINEMTYAPRYAVSPIAFSADGETMAFTNTAGDVVLRNSAGDEVLATPVVDEEPTFERADNVPVTISFGASGKRVGVGYYWGPAVWGCPGAEIERGGSLSVNPPAVVDLTSGPTIVPLNIRGQGPIAGVRALTLEGERFYQATFVDGALSVWPRHDQPTEESVVIEVDDGYATATATIQLRFIQ